MSNFEHIQSIANKVLSQSALLQAYNVMPGSGIDLISYKITEHIVANYNLKRKNAWYGIDLEDKIKTLKQDLAIAYSYRKKFGRTVPIMKKMKEQQYELFSTRR